MRSVQSSAVNRAVMLGVLSALILLVVLWFAWPRSPNDASSRILTFRHPSAPMPAVIDPPFDFYWGDSSAHVEALLGYSSAEIVMRTGTGQGETWTVEGLSYPGLKQALFSFERNALTSVEMLCQYDGWTADQYRSRLDKLTTVFDDRYGERQRNGVRASNQPNNHQNGYTWQVGNTYLSVVCRYSSPSENKRACVSDLVIRYDTKLPTLSSQPDRWSDNVVSPLVSQKLQSKDGMAAPEGSDLGIAGVKLLNTSTERETALNLQLAVKLDSDGLPDPTKAIVVVNFYDTLANGEIVLTDARVNYDWRSRRDWKENNPEMIAVGYVRPMSEPNSQPAHKYFGYVATVYFDGRLESVRAEPLMLVNLFPVRTFISPFENAQAAIVRGDYPTAMRLYRTAAEQGNLFALENLAWFYANGKGVTKDYGQAAVDYERASLQNTPRALNSLAWFLATCPDETVRNGVEAVRHATKACELTYWQEWKYIDTLAAAWAENGDFKRAIEYEQQALGLNGLDEETRAKMEDRLTLYRKRQLFRD